MSWLEWGYLEKGTRTNFSVVKIDYHRALVIGGSTNFGGLSNCDIWDVKAKKWSKGPVLPIEMKYCRAAKLGRYVYVIGQYREFFRLNTRRIEHGWKMLPSAKVDGLGCELVSDDEYVYRVGDNEKRTSLHRYLPEAKVWQVLPEMNIGRDCLGACVIDKKIYVTGGRSGHEGDIILSSFSIYDIVKKKWKSGPNLPTPLYNHSAVPVGNFLFVSGGQDSCHSDPLNSCYVFNMDSQEWFQAVSSLPQVCSGHSSVSFGTNVFVIGGLGGGADGKENETIYTTNVQYISLEKCYPLHEGVADMGDIHSTTSSLKSSLTHSTRSQSTFSNRLHMSRSRPQSRLRNSISIYRSFQFRTK